MIDLFVNDKLEVIVRFLAVLELYKQGMVDILQFENASPEEQDRALLPGSEAGYSRSGSRPQDQSTAAAR